MTALAAESRIEDRLRHRLESPPDSGAFQVGDSRLLARVALSRIYRERAYQPIWIGSDGQDPGPVLALLGEAASHGLDPAHYHAAEIAARLSAGAIGDVGRAIDLELLLTDGALLYATHMLAGRINPVSIDAEWHAEMRGGDIVAIVAEGLAQGDLASALARLAPDAPGYRRLQAALADWVSHDSEPQLNWIPAGPSLRPGMRDARVARLRARLLGDSGDEFDAALAEAVRQFQADNGLQDDGIVGPATLALLNRDRAEVIDTLRANLERWRWLPQKLGPRHILVNIADFRLQAREGFETVLSMKVIVGREYRKTPVFSAPMSYVVLNPYWEVPQSIASQDLLPKFRADPGQVRKLGFELFSGWGANQLAIAPESVDWSRYSASRFPLRVRQRPGPQNALGKVKFMLPNVHAVYLHDTAAPELFNKSVRTFSSGCIRVQNPRALLDWVGAGTIAWPEAPVPEDRTVRLAQRIPVHIEYWTAWVEPDGRLELRPDVYGRDAALIRALRDAPP